MQYKYALLDITAAILVSHNKEKMVLFVSQTNPEGVELFSNVNTFFCSNKFASLLVCGLWKVSTL